MKIKERPFKDWNIDIHHTASPDGRYKFWIANGFLFFKDEGREQLLSLVNIFQRYRIWRELKKEMVLRIDEILLTQTNEN